MKTIQKGDEIKRVDDVEAESLVKNKGYKYVPKSTYKTRVLPKVEEPKKEVPAEPKEKKKAKK